jgi:hypothetical protein
MGDQSYPTASLHQAAARVHKTVCYRSVNRDNRSCRSCSKADLFFDPKPKLKKSPSHLTGWFYWLTVWFFSRGKLDWFWFCEPWLQPASHRRGHGVTTYPWEAPRSPAGIGRLGSGAMANGPLTRVRVVVHQHQRACQR